MDLQRVLRVARSAFRNARGHEEQVEAQAAIDDLEAQVAPAPPPAPAVPETAPVAMESPAEVEAPKKARR